ncbi:toxin-immunity protein system imunity protein CdiI2 [Burkholderia pseudomallei]|uniref:toxin-immunity protein system imunity protein CdiI2 n=1 Tax=Burkholderia pseudomallei TaxID=28450 RepID=UPI0011AB8E57|nr:toxin-immunity protein system imunity protein CdiI2 [Burkholderia pseudomallei]
MAIDLFCYLSIDRGAAESDLNKIRSNHSELFEGKFLISPVRDADFSLKEIAAEHGLVAESFFLVSLNDKNSADLIPIVSKILVDGFNGGVILILQDNECRR